MVTAAGIPHHPTTRARRVLLILAAALVTLIGLGFAAGWIQVYEAPANAGLVIGPECHNIGFEWRGNPGPFINSCS